jgi:hypothetical protein
LNSIIFRLKYYAEAKKNLMNAMRLLKLGAFLISIGLFATFVFVTRDVEQEQIHEKVHDEIMSEKLEEPESIETAPSNIIPDPIHEETCQGIINAYEKQSINKEAPSSLKEHYDNCLIYGSPNPPKEVKKEDKVKKEKPKTNNGNKKAK